MTTCERARAEAPEEPRWGGASRRIQAGEGPRLMVVLQGRDKEGREGTRGKRPTSRWGRGWTPAGLRAQRVDLIILRDTQI
jgi:hypothetical protein